MTDSLDPLTLPLAGSRLLEASAGTGKTWTLAALFLRLVLGHGTARPLAPGEILVMTFTKAATRELAERIRHRLVQAAACFRGEAAPKADDTFLHGLLAAYAGAAREPAAWRLALAAESMDDAAVHTIDAWCQRMLREHAFDSGSLFDEELQANQAALRLQAVQDYWRQQVTPLHGAALDTVLAVWPTVEALLKEAKALQEEALAAATGTLAQCLEREVAQRDTQLAVLKAGWVQRVQAMRAWLEALWERKDKPLNGRLLKSTDARRWLQTLEDWAADPAAIELDMKTGATRFTPSGIRQVFNAGFEAEVAPEFSAFEALMRALPSVPDPRRALRLHAAASVQARMQLLKAQAGSYGFADLLQRLNAALDESTQGERARRLRQRILQQYPVAMVDEFQDTSPLQLSIFDRLYRIADNDPAHTLLLIGDPKQSIYAFRGADIHSYLQARQATAGRHHVLGTNYRSSHALVAAVNACFEAAEKRPGEGAFLYRTPQQEAGLPFEPVAARGRDETFVCSGGAPTPLQWCLDAQLSNKGAAQERFAELCAERIVQALNDEGCGFVQAGKPFERLAPADVAVLVRTWREAGEVQRALRRRGVASVYLSDKESVLGTAEARDLLRLLRAVAAPRDVRRVRAALATSLLGLTVAELLALAHDDERFDAHCERLAQWQRLWQTQGVLAMLRRALHAYSLPARWLAAAAQPALEGERRLTNVLHLAELLQTQSQQLEGEQALLRWLAQQIDEIDAGRSEQAAEEAVLRLESDADRVQVVTLHKSKGLEYPLVFLPFAAHFRPVERKNTLFVRLSPGPHGPRELSLTPTDEQLQAADRDRLREDLRLLYVAFTRARHALWVGAAALTLGNSPACVWHRSALGRLVSGPEPRDPQGLTADLQAWVAACPDQGLEHAEETPANTRLQRREGLAPLDDALPFTATFDRAWAIHSYSGLVRGAGSEAAAAPALAPPASGDLLRVWRDDEPAAEAAPEAAHGATPEAAPEAAPVSVRPAALQDAPWHRFPRGALAGNFLHGQLEWLAAEGFALEASTVLQQALVKRCQRQGWGHRSDDVLAWLRATCTRPLPALGSRDAPGPGVALADLQRTLPEMEFWFPSSGLNARQVDALCRQHILPGQPRPELPERDLRGLLMGFADLVFEHQGRYGVLDYKSNALGAGDADYTEPAMAQAMLQHRYDVQAALYLLALHRLLRARLGAAYAPARHLHGAVYLFLRGVASPSGGGYLVAPPLALIEALDGLMPVAGATA